MTVRALQIANLGTFSANGNRYYFESKTFQTVRLPCDDKSTTLLDMLVDNAGEYVSVSDLKNEELFKSLENLDFLTDSPNRNSKNVPRTFDASVGVNKHISLHFLLTQYCNLGCVYCYNGTDSYQLRNKLKLQKKEALKALRLFLTYADPNGSIAINFLGGEPLLNWATAREILVNFREVSKECGFHGSIHFSVQTNLTFIPEMFIEDVLKYNIDVVVEVDGPRTLHNDLRPHKSSYADSFDMTLKGCSELSSAGVPFRCKAVITAKNISCVEDIEKTHAELGAASTSFGFIRPVDSDYLKFDHNLMPEASDVSQQIALSKKRNGKFHEQFVREIHEKFLGFQKCGTSGCFHKHAAIFTITSDGKFYNCPWFVGDEKNYIGDTETQSIDKERAIRNVENIDVKMHKRCAECPYFNLCGGGCPVTQLLCEGDNDLIDQAVDIRCAQIKPTVQEVLRRRME